MYIYRIEETFSDYGDVLVRFVIGTIFIVAGFGKLFASPGILAFAGMLDSISIPFALFFAYLVGIVELLGGILMILGYKTSWTAIALAFVIFIALIAIHFPQGFNDYKFPLLLFALLLKYIGGSGKISVDNSIKQARIAEEGGF